MKKLLLFPAVLLIAFLCFNERVNAQGSWSRLKNLCPDASGGLMLLLTNGTVMCLVDGGYGGSNVWDLLTPDSHGSYVNGTWSYYTQMMDSRFAFASQVLPSGNVYVAGGEEGTAAVSGPAEQLNTLTNTWTQATGIPSTFNIQDGNSELLYDGTILQAVSLVFNYISPDNLLYNPTTNSFSSAPPCIGQHYESTWVKLPDSSVLNVDYPSQTSERYIPRLHEWVNDGTIPVEIWGGTGSYETGNLFLLPDGRVFMTGDSIYTAYYTPSGNISPGVWTAGPAMPIVPGSGQLGSTDNIQAMMNNGILLCALSPWTITQRGPDYFYEFNYLTNTFTRIKAPDGADSLNEPVYGPFMLNLPDGTILYSNVDSNRYYIYTPGSPPLASGKPVIDNIINGNCSTYKITGKLFNGISEGASDGDDGEMATNYPIIRLSNSTNVYYATTFNWNRPGAVMTGNLEDTAYFTLPAGLPAGTYSLVVTANGNPSNPVSFTPCLTGIDEIKEQAYISVYPNPSNGVFNIQIKNEELGIRNNVEVYNMLGEKVYSNPFTTNNSQFAIDMSSQPNGIYLYRVTSETGELIGDGKLIIQK